MARRVVVTGIGCVTPFGMGAKCVWTGILAGKSCIRKLPVTMEFSQIPSKIAGFISDEGEKSFDWSKYSTSNLREMSRSVVFTLAAAEEAISDAKLPLDSQGKLSRGENVGVSIGIGMADLEHIYNVGSLLVEKHYSKISPYFVPRILTNMAAGKLAIKYGLRGPNHSMSTACTTGAHSIGDGFRLIRNGSTHMMLVGGAEACVNPIALAGFCRMRALSTKSAREPEQASRPFASGRDGFVMSEGASVFVLEERETALRRGVDIYAEVLGLGLSADAFHTTSPEHHGVGAQLAMTRALQDAAIEPCQVQYVNAHATSTPMGDRVECQALWRLFGRQVSISSSKGHLGHLLGASGAIEALVTVVAVQQGIMPATLNLDTPDVGDVDLNLLVSTTSWPSCSGQRIAISNSFGFGGTNASLCFGSV